jgi:hypothetical protein
MTTDAAGKFAITNVRGMAISVKVSKRGYYRVDQSAKSFGFAYGTSSPERHPTPEAPAVFILRAQGTPANLIVRGTNLKLTTNPASIGFSLKAGGPNTEPDVRLLWCSKEQPESKAGYVAFDWGFTLEAVGGGLAERTGAFAFVAPVDGYQSSVSHELVVAPGTPWEAQSSVDYFIQLADGTYGRFNLRVNASPEAFATVTTYWHPIVGDRNLEHIEPSRRP